MCFGEQPTTGSTKTGTASSTSNVTGTKSIDPWLQQAAQQNLGFAQNLQGQPTPQWGQPFTAPQNDAQKAAMDYVTQILGQGGVGLNPQTQQAAGLYAQAAGLAGQAAPTVNAAQVGAAPQIKAPVVNAATAVTPHGVMENFDSYMSPYWQSAIQPQLDEISRNAAIQRTGAGGIGSSATSAGAFGDARHGIVENENFRNEMDARSKATAIGAQNAFNAASDLSKYDKTNLLGADTFNSTQGMQQALANAGFDMQGQTTNANNTLQTLLANAGFQQQAGMANASNALTANGQSLSALLGGASGIAGIGQNATAGNMSLMNMLSNMGNTQWGMDQAAIDKAYADYTANKAYPFLQAQAGNSALGAAYPAGNVTTTGTNMTSGTSFGDTQNTAEDNSGWNFLGSILGSAAKPVGTALGTAALSFI